MNNKLVLLSSLLLLMPFLVIAQHEYSQSIVDVTPTTAVTVASEMNLAPSDCGILAESMAIDPLISHAIGTLPIWIALPNWSGETQGILFVPNQHNFTNPRLVGWWTTKAAWFIAKSYTGEVQLQGFNIADHSPVYFEFGSDEPSAVATLNPEQPGGYVADLDQWAFFPSHMWVSKAGCYRIQAEWDGGLWQQIIAVGNME